MPRAVTDLTTPGEVYGASWNGSFEAPTKNDVYNKIETLGGGGGVTDGSKDEITVAGNVWTINRKALYGPGLLRRRSRFSVPVFEDAFRDDGTWTITGGTLGALDGTGNATNVPSAKFVGNGTTSQATSTIVSKRIPINVGNISGVLSISGGTFTGQVTVFYRVYDKDGVLTQTTANAYTGPDGRTTSTFYSGNGISHTSRGFSGHSFEIVIQVAWSTTQNNTGTLWIYDPDYYRQIDGTELVDGTAPKLASANAWNAHNLFFMDSDAVNTTTTMRNAQSAGGTRGVRMAWMINGGTTDGFIDYIFDGTNKTMRMDSLNLVDISVAGTVIGRFNSFGLKLPASVAGGAPFNIPEGTAPTTPVNGDIWTTNAGVFARINGATVGPFGAGGGGGVTDGDKGDITVSASGATWTVDSATITNAKLANMAAGTFKGRVAAGTGVPQDMTGAQATSMLDVFTASAKGLVPASEGGTTKFLRADGVFAATTTPTVTTQAGAYTVPATGGEHIILASGTVDQLISLPTAVGNTASIVIKKTGLGGIVTIDPSGTQTIDGQLLDTIVHQYEAMRMISDGANWMLI